MYNPRFNWKKFAARAIALFFSLFVSGALFAQDNPATKEKPKKEAEKKELTWVEYKQDLQIKYQKARDKANDIQKQAREKTIESPEFKEELNRFEEQMKQLGNRMKTADEVGAEKREEFKSEMKNQLERLNGVYEDIREDWNKLNK